ncbi:DUF1793-domain-containing protein [Cryphonectria parasitica EP155]|uniref:DUF1793-domain-containing protein n=1 Tax=Cryphonectria parasitica (strain ATCC 38755 / EP155) TaxID=660469 RepID=A0A9P5CJT6_CRYP1|nr:DUF1793-domain-containing protein [Cryphonectria parasitica EP155]KAF3760251.1 DUF1793-domain-containing protein [Cryphonectria parasitica EP155]
MRLSFLVGAAAAALASASTLTPPVLPLIVRNPYLSTWLRSRDAPWEEWPIFWTGNHIGFSVMASVPEAGHVYPLLGRPHDSLGGSHDFKVAFPEYLGATFDASITNLTYSILPPNATLPLTLTLSFLSPITPTSTLRQSLPASYLTVYVEGSFDVNLYIDLNGEWVTGNRDNDIEWSLEDAEPKADSSAGAGIKSWRIQRRTQQLLTEFADQAEWGTLYFSAPQHVQHESGISAVLRKQFSSEGRLRNNIDGNFRKIMDEEPVFAFSKAFKLGSSGKSVDEDGYSRQSKAVVKTDSVMFTFALVQDPVVQFASARGLTFMRPFWATYFPTDQEMIKYHYSDFAQVNALASNYSKQLDVDAYASGSSDYRDIAALSARQVLGATQFSGTPDNPILFLKEISSNGNFQTVDVIFPSFPFFLYTNPRWLAYLLEPLLEHMGSGQYPNKYTMHDLGYHFPNATGHSDGNDEYMPLEECGNMLIMGLALVNAYKYDTQPAFLTTPLVNTGDPIKVQATSIVDENGIDRSWGYGQEDVGTTDLKQAQKWIKKSYKLWKQWTVYLIEESLEPKNQLSTDDFAGWLRLQTNLALKGIIGIRAMSEISDILGETKDAKYYRDIADDYIDKWQGLGLSRDKLFPKLSYEWYGAWTTIYNLYADSLLCFHLPDGSATDASLPAGWQQSQQSPIKEQASPKKDSTFVPDYVYKLASDWYHNVMQKYGLPLDSRHLYTKSDWEFFAAAVASKQTRTEILTLVAKWLNETTTDNPFTDLYDTEGTGGYPDGLGFRARPVVGGHFAFLALERACGGQATEALSFLDAAEAVELDVKALVEDEKAYGMSQMEEMEL